MITVESRRTFLKQAGALATYPLVEQVAGTPLFALLVANERPVAAETFSLIPEQSLSTDAILQARFGDQLPLYYAYISQKAAGTTPHQSFLDYRVDSTSVPLSKKEEERPPQPNQELPWRVWLATIIESCTNRADQARNSLKRLGTGAKDAYVCADPSLMKTFDAGVKFMQSLKSYTDALALDHSLPADLQKRLGENFLVEIGALYINPDSPTGSVVTEAEAFRLKGERKLSGLKIVLPNQTATDPTLHAQATTMIEGVSYLDVHRLRGPYPYDRAHSAHIETGKRLLTEMQAAHAVQDNPDTTMAKPGPESIAALQDLIDTQVYHSLVGANLPAGAIFTSPDYLGEKVLPYDIKFLLQTHSANRLQHIMQEKQLELKHLYAFQAVNDLGASFPAITALHEEKKLKDGLLEHQLEVPPGTDITGMKDGMIAYMAFHDDLTTGEQDRMITHACAGVLYDPSLGMSFTEVQPFIHAPTVSCEYRNTDTNTWVAVAHTVIPSVDADGTWKLSIPSAGLVGKEIRVSFSNTINFPHKQNTSLAASYSFTMK